MPNSSKTRWRLAAILSVVMMLVLISGVMVVELLFKVESNVPSITMDIVPMTLAASDKTEPVQAEEIKVEADNKEPQAVPEAGAPAAKPPADDSASQVSDSAVKPQDNNVSSEKPQSEEAEAKPQNNDAQADVQPETEALRPNLEVKDDQNVVWETETQVEIFHAAYENESGEITVRSAGNDKVIAPGTSNVYNFYINNSGNAALDYTVSSEAEITVKSGQKLRVPLVARLSDWRGNYMVGSADSWVPVEALDGASTKGSLTADYHAKYSLEWQWPFEGDDALDTMLGNLAASGDEIRVTIKLMVYATDALDPDIIEGIPNTGDNAKLALWIALFVCSAFMFPLLLVLGRRKKDEE